MKIPKIDYQKEESITDLFNRNQELVHERFLECIIYGLENELESVYVFELGDTELFLELDKDNWIGSLECCIDYFSSVEDYEKCLICKKTKNEIEQL